ncbi:CIC11C00000000838 [Sungouiella intermedia]|uniref:Alternative oxidase n=1 Tax=Sungouiella intermedia TaxID=45354 RepID=A0A1L0BN75_9ASCO|nr:CIC11C00000000838 [[Candida] intermedia]
MLLARSRVPAVIKSSLVRNGFALRALSTSHVSFGALDIKTKVLEHEDDKNDTRFITHPLFPHERWSDEDCAAVEFVHRPPVTKLDKLAYQIMYFCRRTFDTVTGYKKPKTLEEKEHRFVGTRWEMTENKWLTRVIFLESVAGVPGMVAAFLRHLHLLRLLKRDKAWIETLLDEAYNERIHLLTFIKLGQPSWFTKTFIYLGQGVFCNMFFFLYLLSPRYCHRFVGYLEEEAVSTYTHLIHDLENHKLPAFDNVKVPMVAQQYYPELNEKSTFLDLIQRIRADESKHREVNHTLANLDQKNDRNPYAMKIEGVDQPQPEYGLKSKHKAGWEKKDLIL